MPKITNPDRIYLTEKRAQIMVALFKDGYTFADIAVIFYCDRSWVKSIVDKSKKK